MIGTINGTGVSMPDTHAPQVGESVVDKIFSAAQPGVVYSAPVVSGAYTIITASEVMAVGGFGGGSGSGGPTGEGSGSGGGGASRARPVATIIIGPDGVKVQPIVDATRVALAAMVAWAGVAGALARRARRNKLR